MLESDQKKTAGATRGRRAAATPEKTAAKTTAPAVKPKRKTLLARVVKTAKTILKPRRSPARPKAIEAPPILLEGDQSAPPPVSGPGEKYFARPHAAGAAFRNGGNRTARSLRHQKTVPDRARPALALRALGFDAANSSRS